MRSFHDISIALLIGVECANLNPRYLSFAIHWNLAPFDRVRVRSIRPLGGCLFYSTSSGSSIPFEADGVRARYVAQPHCDRSALRAVGDPWTTADSFAWLRHCDDHDGGPDVAVPFARSQT